MLSIHNNLSVGAQNVTGAYVIIMLVYRRLLIMLVYRRLLIFQAQKLFVQGYNLEVHDVIKYMRKHRATVLN